jgi:hypothetical protein
MKKQTKKPAAKSNDVPVSKTVARPLVPAAPLPPPPEGVAPGSPEEAYHYAIVGNLIAASRHRREADRIIESGGVPYTGKDKRLAGSTIYTRDALLKATDRAKEEKKKAEQCVEVAMRASEARERYRDRKAQQDLAASNLKLAEALRASNTPPPSSSPSVPAPGHSKPACVKWYQEYESIAFANGDEYEVTARSIWKDVLFALLAPDDPEGWAELGEGWEDGFKGSGVKLHLKELKRKHIESEAKAKHTQGTHRFRLV